MSRRSTRHWGPGGEPGCSFDQIDPAYGRFEVMALTDEQLTLLDETQEVHVRTHSGDDSKKTIIWIVVSDGEVYVRSVRGDDGNWYQRALADPRVEIIADGDVLEFIARPVERTAEISAVSNALRSKYSPGSSLDAMVRTEVLDTTLRLEPRD